MLRLRQCEIIISYFDSATPPCDTPNIFKRSNNVFIVNCASPELAQMLKYFGSSVVTMLDCQQKI